MSELIKQVSTLRNSQEVEGSSRSRSNGSLSVKKCVQKDDEKMTGKTDTSTGVVDEAENSTQSLGCTNVSSSKKQTKTPEFGGMKKGFLFGSSSSQSRASAAAKSKPKHDDKVPEMENNSIPYIKPKDPAANEKQFEMAEVQEAMKAGQNIFQSKGE